MFWVTEFTYAEYTLKGPQSFAIATKFWRKKTSKNCTDFSYIQKYKNLRFVTVTLLMLKTAKINVKIFSV